MTDDVDSDELNGLRSRLNSLRRARCGSGYFSTSV